MLKRILLNFFIVFCIFIQGGELIYADEENYLEIREDIWDLVKTPQSSLEKEDELIQLFKKIPGSYAHSFYKELGNKQNDNEFSQYFHAYLPRETVYDLLMILWVKLNEFKSNASVLERFFKSVDSDIDKMNTSLLRKNRLKCLTTFINNSEFSEDVISWQYICPHSSLGIGNLLLSGCHMYGYNVSQELPEFIRSKNDVDLYGKRIGFINKFSELITKSIPEGSSSHENYLKRFTNLDNDIFQALSSLNDLANTGIGAGIAMPLYYRSIHDWHYDQISNKKSIYTCYNDSFN